MNEQKAIDLKRAIIELENTIPLNDSIVTYSDFLKIKNYLSSYQFNALVFDSLLSLTNSLWKSDKRISRIDLLIKLRQYLSKKDTLHLKDYQTRPYSFTETLSLNTRKQLFELFKNTIIESKYVTVKQLGEVRGIANNLLINVGLTADEEKWLCDNVQSYPYVLNRILRYPQKSNEISNWAWKNFTNKLFVTRRAELIGWLLDEDQAYEVDNQRLLDDFEVINQLDKQAIKSYRDDVYANEVIERDLGDILPRITYNDIETGELTEGRVALETPELTLTRRPYSIPVDMSSGLFSNIPDFKVMTDHFKRDLDSFQRKTMIWGIAYSRLDNEIKTELYKKHYSTECYETLFKVGKKTNNAEILKWLLNTL